MAQATDYSDLEVRLSPQKPREAYSTLQVNKPDLFIWDTQKQLARPFDSYDAGAPEKVEHPLQPDTKPRSRFFDPRPKTFWVVLLLMLVAVASIVGGAVGGTVHRNHEGRSSSAHSHASSNGPAVPPATSLASAAWNDTQGFLQQRLYVQAKDQQIWEYSWNSDQDIWLLSNDSIAQARWGSPLAAAVAYKGRTTVSNT